MQGIINKNKKCGKKILIIIVYNIFEPTSIIKV